MFLFDRPFLHGLVLWTLTQLHVTWQNMSMIGHNSDISILIFRAINKPHAAFNWMPVFTVSITDGDHDWFKFPSTFLCILSPTKITFFFTGMVWGSRLLSVFICMACSWVVYHDVVCFLIPTNIQWRSQEWTNHRGTNPNPHFLNLCTNSYCKLPPIHVFVRQPGFVKLKVISVSVLLYLSIITPWGMMTQSKSPV